MKQTVALIMAGGSGTRFWPESRQSFPKQFLSFFKSQSLIQMTVSRMEDIVGRENVFVILGQRHIRLFKEQNPDFPVDNIIPEPCGRDTSAAIGLAAVVISRLRPGSTMMVCPADHMIDDLPAFRKIMQQGAKIAEQTGCLITIGIPPAFPSSAYGYIEAGEKISSRGGVDASEVKRFREKPDQMTAKSYISKGNYFWNAGIFIWQTGTILEEISTHLPELYDVLTEIGSAFDSDNVAETIERVFPTAPRISIDFGVMEKSKRILTIKGDFFWDDLGSWTAYAGYIDKDKQGNSARGLYIAENSENCIIISDKKHMIALSGVRDLIIIHTNDVTLVCDRKDDQGIKKLVNRLKEDENFAEYI